MKRFLTPFIPFMLLLAACEQQEDKAIVGITTGGYSDIEVGVDFEESIIKYDTWIDAVTEGGGAERITVALEAYVDDNDIKDVSRLWHSSEAIADVTFTKSEVRRSSYGSDSRVTIIDSLLLITTPLRGFDFEHRLIYQVAVVETNGSSYTMPYQSFDTDTFRLVGESVMSNLTPTTAGSEVFARRLVTYPAKINFGDYTHTMNPILTVQMTADYDSNKERYIVDYDFNRSFIETLNNHPSPKMWIDVEYSDGSEVQVLETIPTTALAINSNNPITGEHDWTVHRFYDYDVAPTKSECRVTLFGEPVQYDSDSNDDGYFDIFGERNYNVASVTQWYQAVKFTFDDFEGTSYLLYSNITFSNRFIIQEFDQLKVESVSVVSNDFEVEDSSSSNSWYATSTVVISVKFENVEQEFEFTEGFSSTYYKR